MNKLNEIFDHGYTRAKENDRNKMSLGVFVCAFSHLYLYRMLKANNYNNVLILEDDAMLVSKNIDHVVDVYKNLPDNWDVFFLGYQGEVKSNYNNFYKGVKYKMGDVK